MYLTVGGSGTAASGIRRDESTASPPLYKGSEATAGILLLAFTSNNSQKFSCREQSEHALCEENKLDRMSQLQNVMLNVL